MTDECRFSFSTTSSLKQLIASNEIQRRLVVYEVRCDRKLLGIQWQDEATNNSIRTYV